MMKPPASSPVPCVLFLLCYLLKMTAGHRFSINFLHPGLSDHVHQLNLSGLGSLNGRGFGFFWGFGRGFGRVCLGIGNCLGLGCCLHQASPMISLISIGASQHGGGLQKHHPKSISTSPQDFAQRNFLNAGGISPLASPS